MVTTRARSAAALAPAPAPAPAQPKKAVAPRQLPKAVPPPPPPEEEKEEEEEEEQAPAPAPAPAQPKKAVAPRQLPKAAPPPPPPEEEEEEEEEEEAPAYLKYQAAEEPELPRPRPRYYVDATQDLCTSAILAVNNAFAPLKHCSIKVKLDTVLALTSRKFVRCEHTAAGLTNSLQSVSRSLLLLCAVKLFGPSVMMRSKGQHEHTNASLAGMVARFIVAEDGVPTRTFDLEAAAAEVDEILACLSASFDASTPSARNRTVYAHLGQEAAPLMGAGAIFHNLTGRQFHMNSLILTSYMVLGAEAACRGSKAELALTLRDHIIG